MGEKWRFLGENRGQWPGIGRNSGPIYRLSDIGGIFWAIFAPEAGGGGGVIAGSGIDLERGQI
jgi:hypothetical protein